MNDIRDYTVNVETAPNAMFSYKGKLFYSDSFSNGIFRYEPRYKEIECVGEFKEYGIFREYLYNSAVISGTRAIFVPYNADSIALFEIEQNLLEDVKLPIEIRGKKEKFFASELVGNKVYLFGYRIDDIYIFELESQSYSKVKIDKQFLKLMATSGESGFLIRDILAINETVYFSSIHLNYIFKLNTKNDQITAIPIPIDNKGIYFMTLDTENHKICIVPTNGARLIFFEVSSGKFVEKIVGEQEIEVVFSKPLYYNGDFYLMPCWGDQSICIKAETYELINNSFKYDNENARGKEYVNGIRVGHYIIYSANSYHNRRCFVYNCEQEVGENVKIIIPRKINKSMIKEPINETENFALVDYVKSLVY